MPSYLLKVNDDALWERFKKVVKNDTNSSDINDALIKLIKGKINGKKTRGN